MKRYVSYLYLRAKEGKIFLLVGEPSTYEELCGESARQEFLHAMSDFIEKAIEMKADVRVFTKEIDDQLFLL